MDFIGVLADPVYVAKFQKFCGVEFAKPDTCDHQTQTSTSSSGSGEYYRENRNKTQNKINGDATTTNGVYLGQITGEINGNILCNNDEVLSSAKLRKTELVENQTTFDYVEELIEDVTVLDHKNIFRSNPLKDVRLDKRNNLMYVKSVNSPHNNTVNGAERSIQNKDCVSACVDDPKAESPDEASWEPMPYTIKYNSLLCMAHFGAFLGNEEFYLTFFPFCIWNVDFLIVRQVGMLWCLVMYLGQVTKEYLRWPRPPCPPVVRLETHYLQEYSMPSTHAMAGTAIPLFLAYLVVNRYQVPVSVAATIAVLWFTITCFSRLYLGVHTLLDLLAGFLFSILIFFTFLRYVEVYDYYTQIHPLAAPVLLTTSLSLCTICYPNNYKISSKSDTVQIVAATAGCNIGAWIGYQVGVMHEPEAIVESYAISTPTLMWCGLALLRFVTGVLMLGVAHFVLRWATIRIFSYLYGLDTPDKTHPNVITAYKFTTYIIMGGVISLVIPLVHAYFGIHRPAMFYEVL